MCSKRIFESSQFFQPSDGEPIRSVIAESEHAVIVAWYLKPGQEISPHIHPHGQDTWTILNGEGKYYLDIAGTTKQIRRGDVVIAPIGSVHGVCSSGDEPLIFISVVSPADAGFQPVSVENFGGLHP